MMPGGLLPGKDGGGDLTGFLESRPPNPGEERSGQADTGEMGQEVTPIHLPDGQDSRGISSQNGHGTPRVWRVVFPELSEWWQGVGSSGTRWDIATHPKGVSFHACPTWGEHGAGEMGIPGTEIACRRPEQR